MNLILPPRAISPRSFVLLAPPEATTYGRFQSVVRDNALFRRLQSSMQRMRGRIYLEDGAITRSEIAADGRHILPCDEQSWHLLTVDAAGSVLGCTHFLRHTRRDLRFDGLRVSNAAIASHPHWGPRLPSIIESELFSARQKGFAYVEVGGWAIDKAARCTTDCVRAVLATFAWSRLLGGAFGICTATERHHSATILQKLGGRAFEHDGETMPAYYDERYGCRMRLLRFDSRAPSPRYEDSIARMEQTLRSVPVCSAEGPIGKLPHAGLYQITESPWMVREGIAGVA